MPKGGATGPTGATEPAAPTGPTSQLTFKERPAWLDEKFYDKATGAVNVEALAADRQHFREIVSKGDHKPPAKPEDYKIEFDAKTKPVAQQIFIHDEKGNINDPVFAAVAKVAHAEGISNKQLQALAVAMVTAQADFIPPAIDPKAELEKLGKNGLAMMNSTDEFAKGEVKAGRWTDAEYQMFKAWTPGAAEHTLMRKILEGAGRVPEIALEMLNQAASSKTAEELRSEMGKLRERSRKGENVQADFERLQAEYDKLYGGEAARTSIARAG